MCAFRKPIETSCSKIPDEHLSRLCTSRSATVSTSGYDTMSCDSFNAWSAEDDANSVASSGGSDQFVVIEADPPPAAKVITAQKLENEVRFAFVFVDNV